MLWQKAKDDPSADKLVGPKTLRSTLVPDGGRRVELEDLDLDTCELIGKGAYGMVHKVQERTTGQSRVMKTVVRPQGWDDKKLKQEAELLRHLDHPHILRIFSWYEDGQSINIVMEHCDGGELIAVVRRGRRHGHVVSELWMATAVRQSFEALVYLHSKGVVHKDLKGQNILLLCTAEDDGSRFEAMPHIVICDLGIAEVCCRGIFGMGMRGNKVAGTASTMAPEVWTGSCGPKSDVWSMGCVMFELFANRLPFRVTGVGPNAPGKYQEMWLDLHRKGPDWKLMSCSPPATNLCKQLLTFKESARPSAVDCLKHPWFKLCEEVPLTEAQVSSLVSALLSWHRRNPMQRALCLKMAVGCTCINRFASLFTKFDKDSSGILDRAEVLEALKQLGMDRSTAKAAAAALDVNGDNSCEYLEFVAACLSSLEERFDELLRQEFRTLDRFGRGELRPQDLAPLLDDLRPLAAARGLQLAEIDANGDGVVSFTEFCDYFGRAGVKYAYSTRPKDAAAKSAASSLGMKEHIRIVNDASGLEEGAAGRLSASGSPERVAKPGEAKEAKPSRTSSSLESEQDATGSGQRPEVKKPRPSRTSSSLESEQDVTGSGQRPEVKKPKPSRTSSSLESEQDVTGSGQLPEATPDGPKKPKPLRSKSSSVGPERDMAGSAQVPEASATKKPHLRRKPTRSKLRADAAVRKPALEARATGEAGANGGKQGPEVGSAGDGSKAPAKTEAPLCSKAHPSEASTAEDNSAAHTGAQEEGLRQDGAAKGLAESAPEAEPQDGAIGMNEEGSGDAAVRELQNPCLFKLSEDGSGDSAVRELQNPCLFKLSEDDLNLITTSFVAQTSVASLERAEAAHCAGCSPIAALTADRRKYGLQGNERTAGVWNNEAIPTGHCIVSL